jgi:hypothetical protein
MSIIRKTRYNPNLCVRCKLRKVTEQGTRLVPEMR